MNYQIITDEQALDQFINWLPKLHWEEVYYLQLFGRKKYLAEGIIQSGQNSLARFVCKKDQIKDRIRQLEISLGCYKNREVVLPQECLAMYICPNPRSQKRAAKSLLKKLVDCVTLDYEGYNVHELAITELHKACSRKVYMDFDFDEIPKEMVLTKLPDYINIDAVEFLQTRGGFHLLVKIDKIADVFRNTWYNDITNLGADAKGDDLIPIPGCYQGGFIPILSPMVLIK